MEARTILLGACALIFLLGIPLVSRLVPPNRLYGFRTTKTLSRPDIWYPANLFAGYALMLAAAISALVISCAPALSEMEDAAIIAALVLGATAAAFAYLKKLA